MGGACGPVGGGGPVGTTGTCGVQGPQGADGDEGACGVLGYCGVRGTTGHCGIKGSSGACGLGYQGVTGTCGIKGTTGQQGSCGIKGTTGQQGSCGIKGTSGSSGTCGIKGTTGQQGSCGVKGTTGTAGTCGIKGTSGTAGTAGSCGFEGYCGIQGACGVESYNEFTRKYKFTIANTSPGATWFSAYRSDDATAEANSANVGYIYINENDGYHDNSAFFTGISNEAGYLVVNKIGPDDIHVRYEIISDSNEGSGVHKLGVKQIYGGTGDQYITFSSSAVYGMVWHPESPRKPFGIDIYQGMCGPQNAINITNTGACGTYNYGKITWFEGSNDQGSMHIDQARTFSLNVPKLLGGSKTEVLTINSAQSTFNTLVTVSSSTAGVPSATLSLSSKNLIFFNPSTGTGTHIFTNVTSSYGNTVYTVINAHASRSFRINNDISGVYVWRGLTRTIQPGGCITFATNANASKIYEINSVSAASHS